MAVLIEAGLWLEGDTKKTVSALASGGPRSRSNTAAAPMGVNSKSSGSASIRCLGRRAMSLSNKSSIATTSESDWL